MGRMWPSGPVDPSGASTRVCFREEPNNKDSFAMDILGWSTSCCQRRSDAAPPKAAEEKASPRVHPCPHPQRLTPGANAPLDIWARTSGRRPPRSASASRRRTAPQPTANMSQPPAWPECHCAPTWMTLRGITGLMATHLSSSPSPR